MFYMKKRKKDSNIRKWKKLTVGCQSETKLDSLAKMLPIGIKKMRTVTFIENKSRSRGWQIIACESVARPNNRPKARPTYFPSGTIVHSWHNGHPFTDTVAINGVPLRVTLPRSPWLRGKTNCHWLIANPFTRFRAFLPSTSLSNLIESIISLLSQ